MPRRIRIAVLAGGRSSEREISLLSARSVSAALDPERYDVVPVGIDADGRWQLLPGNAALGAPAGEARETGTSVVPGGGANAIVGRTNGGPPEPLEAVDVVFPVLHGPFGEDGTVQGLLETLGLPYVGAGVLGSAVAMDKDVCKAVLRNAGIPVAASITLRHGRVDPADPALAAEVGATLGWPVFVKPASLGSSVGITRVEGPDGLPSALELAFSHDPKALVEELLTGREVECGVLGNEELVASDVGEIVPHGGWYDYAAKYDEGGSDIIIPADIHPDDAGRVRAVAVAAFEACECAGMARVDFFLRPDGSLVLNEINTIPGFTSTSVYARLFESAGIPYPALIDRLVELALERHERAGRYRH